MMNRRTFLTALASVLTLPVPSIQAVASEPGYGNTRYLGARNDLQGRHLLSGFDDRGRIRFDIPLPDRGHDIAVHPDGRQAAVIARRPGRFLVVFDSEDGSVLHRVEAAADRHFYGHAVFSADGQRLFTTENDYQSGHGIVAVRDAAAGFKAIDELPSHGIGPHQLVLGSEPGVLVVANGGILTDPRSGRDKLNLDTMSPSLVYVDSATGRLLSEHRLPPELHQLSIRHLAVNTSGQACIAMQYQGPPGDRPALIGLHSSGEESIRLLEPPPEVLDRMENYCGSVRADASGRWFAVSAPRGSLVTFWSADGRYAGNTEVPDGCGIAATTDEAEFMLSSGAGGLFRYRIDNSTRSFLAEAPLFEARWDNHLSSTIFPIM